jgi:chemotaxis response regulator CheB
VRRTRVLICGMSQMLGDVVRTALEAQRDVEIAGDVADPAALTAATEAIEPAVVLCGVPPAAPALLDGLLRAHPGLRIVEVLDDGRRGRLLELRPHRTDLGELSPGSLASLMRALA